MTLRRNVVANYVGQIWVALMSVAFVPIYLRYIGTDGYGLVGFFAVLTSIFSLLDAGFGAAVTRELARLSAKESETERHAARELVRSLEMLFWALSFVIGVVMILVAPFLAQHWLNVGALGADAATTGLRLMGVAFLFQWPTSFYSGCLMGLQRQVRLNVLLSLLGTLRGIGAVLVLLFVAPTVSAFFAWQVIAAVITAATMYAAVWKALPGSGIPAKFSWIRLRSVGRFAAGVGAINVLAFLLTQIDKVIVSAILPLGQFGVYALAWLIASLLYRVTGPIYNAVYPRFSQLLERGDGIEVTLLFRQSSQTMSVAIVPVALCIAFFSEELIWLWTKDSQIAHDANWVLALLMLGTLLNGFMHLPYGLQLAHGWTSLALKLNTISVCILGPLTYFLTKEYGLVGAAIVWPIINCIYVLVGAWICFGKLLPMEKWSWYWRAVVLPSAICSTIFGAVKYCILDAMHSRAALIVQIGIALFAAVGATAMASPVVRSALIGRLLDCRKSRRLKLS